MNKKLLIFNFGLLIFSIIVFGEYLINYAKFSSAYILFLLFFILLALHVFVVGLIINKEKTYKKNIKLYIILYIILLISLTIFINRPDFALFDAHFLKNYLSEINIIPFKTIIHFLTGNINLGVKIYNIMGNLIALMPLSFLLVLLDKKYESYKSQLKILFIAVLGIEVFQFLLSSGRLDIDDFILNIGGAILFFTVLKKTNLITPARHLFNSDLNIPQLTKYIILGLVSLAIIVMDILFIIDLNVGRNITQEHDYFYAHPADDSCNSLRKVEMDNYDLYLNCINVSFTDENDYYFTLEEALKNNEIDLDNLNKYFKIIDYQEDVTVYQDDDFSMYICNDSKDIYVGSKDMEYNEECSND